MMENDIEKLVKKALEGYEIPYQDGAWESFQTKMNEAPKSNSYKWWILGAAAGIFAISTIYFLNVQNTENLIHSKNNPQNEKPISESKEKVTVSKTVSHPKVVSKVVNKKQQETQSNIEISNSASLDNFDNNNSNVKENNANQLVSSNFISSTNQNEISLNEIKNTNQNENLNHSETEFFPTFSNKCKNESIWVENKNGFELILKTPSGREIGVEGNSKVEINLSEVGVYQIGYLNTKSSGNFIESSNFRVHGLPALGLDIDDDITYKNGLPIINADANTMEELISWKVNQKTYNKSGKSLEISFFNKGSYKISAHTKNELGCEVIESKTIQINEDYNLLAMSAFNPNSLDYRNNTFLPYALKERNNTTFRMIVIDPENGGVVFETTEATNPWTGIDRRDGKMVDAQKAYIWKVTLSNPEPGEKSEYKGTVVRVP
jgi:hypothetical protein